MEIIRPDAATFLDLAGPALSENEARHNLILGLAGTLALHPEMYPTFHLWIVRDGTGVVGAALMTPPHNLVLADPGREGALESLLEGVRADGVVVPGVVGNLPAVRSFADAWTFATGAIARVVMTQGVYELRSVREVPAAPGAARPAGKDDRDLLDEWYLAFSEEAQPEEDRDLESIRRRLDIRLTATDSGFWLWEDEGSTVSLAGYWGSTTSGIRMGPVYTPPEHRRRGYATSLVALLSRSLLERGFRACFLYTDLANPTSNGIYADIGYEQVCDSVEYRFG